MADQKSAAHAVTVHGAAVLKTPHLEYSKLAPGPSGSATLPTRTAADTSSLTNSRALHLTCCRCRGLTQDLTIHSTMGGDTSARPRAPTMDAVCQQVCSWLVARH
jgi:hypothetical protein